MLTEPWWRYSNAADAGWFDSLYHWFNMAEGVAWLVIGALVLARYVRHRSTTLELWYALAFLTFAASDFYEAWEQSAWLVSLKLVNLVTLFYLRRDVMSKHYPDASLY